MNRFSALTEDDARLARLFGIVGIAGLIAALVSGLLGIAVVLSVSNSMDRSLEVTSDAVTAADETVELAAATVGIVSESFSTLVPSAGVAATAFADAATVIADTTAVVTVDVPDALDAVLDAMPAIESTATVIDGALRVLSFVGVDYDPEIPFEDAVAELETAIAPLPDQLRAQTEPLDALAEDFEDFGMATAEISEDLVALQRQLEEAELLLETYASTAVEATAVVTDIRSDLAWQRWLMVGVVLLVSLGFVTIQVVPLSLAQRLRSGAGVP